MTVHQNLTLGSAQAEGRGNLDSLAGCGIIGTHVLCTIETVQLELGGLTFFVPGLSPRRVLAVESKTGAAQNELGAAPVLCLACGYEVVGSVQVSDCIGLQAATMRGMARCIGACAGRMGSSLLFG